MADIIERTEERIVMTWTLPVGSRVTFRVTSTIDGPSVEYEIQPPNREYTTDGSAHK